MQLKEYPQTSPEAVTQTRKGKSFLPKTVGTNPVSRSRWKPLNRPSSEDTMHVLQVHPQPARGTSATGCRLVSGWTSLSPPAFKCVHTSPLELGYLDTRRGIGGEPVPILLHHLLTGPGAIETGPLTPQARSNHTASLSPIRAATKNKTSVCGTEGFYKQNKK